MEKKNEGYKVDFINNTITITKDFYKKSQSIGTPEFYKMKQLAGLGFKVMTREKQERRACETRITFQKMENYIKCLDDGEKWMQQFAGAKEEAKSKKNGYQFVREWFFEAFPDYLEQHAYNEEGKIIHAAPSVSLLEKKPA